ncbi:cobalamin B12-binding domain-containing protein [Umezawaea sp.]|uniref:cobalamin B12-binding domain-containing protein n=1 Tax=Umezawaea sp. TaxID=1955258 RepID=UPI002ED0C1A7
MRRALVCTVESDAHIWNLVYLEKLLEEHGMRVRNLGCCTPITEVVRAVARRRPDLLVVSSVNGHGHHGARLLLSALRRDGLDVAVVVGGKLTTAESDNVRVREDLLARGCAEVFTGEDAVPRFREFLRARLPVRHPSARDTTETGVRSCTL